MNKIVSLNTKAPWCPLCHKLMERHYVLQRNIFVWACDTDRIAIDVRDPMVGKWDAALEKATGGEGIECPACNAKMRYFSTSIGYIKTLCPKKGCGASVVTTEPDRDKTLPQ